MEMRERFERRRRVRFEKFETARVLRRQEFCLFSIEMYCFGNLSYINWFKYAYGIFFNR